jgi:3-keto-5-aminohexanoate cleavage enzyme
MSKLIITVVPTGFVYLKKDNPNIPLTPKEIGASVEEAYHAGASIAHLHARDSKGTETIDRSVFKEVVDEVKKRSPEILLELSTGTIFYPFEDKFEEKETMKMLELKPDLASLDLGLDMADAKDADGVVYGRLPGSIRRLAKKMLDLKIKPNLVVYNDGMLSAIDTLIKEGLLHEPYYITFILGSGMSIFKTPPTPLSLITLTSRMPPNSSYSVRGKSGYHLPLVTASIGMGGHVGTGMEDTPEFSTGVLAKSNAQLVERLATISKHMGRDVASGSEARKILGIG